MPSLPLPLRYRAYGADSLLRQAGAPPAGMGLNTRMAKVLSERMRVMG